MKTLIQDGWSLHRNLNPRPPEYEAGLLPFQVRRGMLLSDVTQSPSYFNSINISCRSYYLQMCLISLSL
jgi:hypothetical protein